MRGVFKNSTVFCISIASRPSKFGYTLFNTAFHHVGLDMAYKPFQVEESQLGNAIEGIRGLGIRGCGISMPHKQNALQHVDGLDMNAEEIGAINTIVNDGGMLKGYNTDYSGAREIYEKERFSNDTTVVLLGAGGVARAQARALVDIGCKVTVVNRTRERAERLASDFNCNIADWEERDRLRADCLVNCTSVGMRPNEDGMPLGENSLNNYECVIDLVIKPVETKMLMSAEMRGKKIIKGSEFTLMQAAKQFELYTGKCPPLSVMRHAMERLLGAKE